MMHGRTLPKVGAREETTLRGAGVVVRVKFTPKGSRPEYTGRFRLLIQMESHYPIRGGEHVILGIERTQDGMSFPIVAGRLEITDPSRRLGEIRFENLPIGNCLITATSPDRE